MNSAPVARRPSSVVGTGAAGPPGGGGRVDAVSSSVHPLSSPVDSPAYPPETAEGWYALHQVYRRGPIAADPSSGDLTGSSLQREGDFSNGWSAVVSLIGSTADLMLVHFRQTLDEIGECQARYGARAQSNGLELAYSFLSVTEAGFYHITAQLAAGADARAGSVGDELYRSELAKRMQAELESEHVRRRLYPPLPAGMPYVCFYPMSKRREAGQNWYGLPLAERSRLMQTHGMTGRRYTGRIQQIITGAIGFDKWEWGVTLFAKDPIDFKKLVTDMRFDEVSAQYAEFGEFYVGKVLVVEGV